MIVQKMKCPIGCENATFSESFKSVNTSNNNLLLDSQKGSVNNVQKVKVYTCNCCKNSFEIKESINSGRMVL
jgi:hypothetical protein